ncbi:ferredoxin--NADP reductase [Pacificoceanicola onchidii]|uniref:ferredoxin--NADP reductase n=1 Tax=Pacificoceanicola onchidii TaxID=2562685 RepID=UPI0010A5B24D|nr:FAD-dependent oxidoreductase [Pacificoceanicola onchidii]
MKTRIHAIAGAIGLLMILLFWTSTIVSELFGSHETIASVKGWILSGMFILIPAMAIVGGSGMSLGKGQSGKLVSAKQKRMPIIAANGLLILVPMAFILESKASAGTFDTVFYALQGVELIAGATNLTLMGLNMRDGLKLTGRTSPAATVTILERERVANDTLAIRLTKPAGFSFTPGQAIRLTIPAGASNGAGEARVFSIANAPHETDLQVVTRLRDSSSFKQSLKSMPGGAALQIAGPLGSFTKDTNSARPTVFLAGGIGITPFLSMLRDADHRNGLTQTTLFYSNRSPDDSAMLAELQELDEANSEFELVATMTESDADTTWKGETGYIDATMLARHLSDVKRPIYYCVGPGKFVSAMSEMLKSAGVDAARIRVEQFGGY